MYEASCFDKTRMGFGPSVWKQDTHDWKRKPAPVSGEPQAKQIILS